MTETTKPITEDTLKIAMDLLRPFMSEEHRQAILAERMRQANGVRVLTCAYCGVSYPPTTPNSQHQLLTGHGQMCSEHPIRDDLREVIHEWNTGTTVKMDKLVKAMARKYHFEF